MVSKRDRGDVGQRRKEVEKFKNCDKRNMLKLNSYGFAHSVKKK